MTRTTYPMEEENVYLLQILLTALSKDNEMIIIGLTGGIGAGKSNLSKFLKREGIPVHSSDEEIHRLMQNDRDIQRKIKSLWPSVFVKGKIDRVKLRNCVLFSTSGLSLLEDIFYKKLVEKQKEFLKANQKIKEKVVVVDVPLLFETGLDRYCHYVMVASSPLFLRMIRVLKRKGMNKKQFDIFESHQLKDIERKRKADFIIPCGIDKGRSYRVLKRALTSISHGPKVRWQGKWPKQLKRISHGTRNRFRH